MVEAWDGEWEVLELGEVLLTLDSAVSPKAYMNLCKLTHKGITVAQKAVKRVVKRSDEAQGGEFNETLASFIEALKGQL